MSSSKLVRATPENGIFKKLKHQWDKEIKALGAENSPEGYYQPMMAHAANIAAESPQDSKYGIYVLVNHDENEDVSSYEGMVHVNFAKFHPHGKTVRLVWNLIAPRHQLGDSKFEVAKIQGSFLTEALELCSGFAGCTRLQIYLGNSIDKEFVSVAVAYLGRTATEPTFSIAGNWLYVTHEDRKLRVVHDQDRVRKDRTGSV